MLAIPFSAQFIPTEKLAHAETATDPAPHIDPVGTPNGKKILFDNTHGETAGAADWVIDGGFSDFGHALANKGYAVQELRKTTPITLSDLQGYDVLVLGESNIPFKSSEQQALLDYVKGGGSIFFIADHYNSDRNKNRWDSGEIFNGYRRGAFGVPTKGMSTEEANSTAMQGVTSTDWLGSNFGIRFRYNALNNITSGEMVVSPTDSFGITQGVSTVEMHAGSTLEILDPHHAKGLIFMPTTNEAWPYAVDQGVYEGGGVAEGPFAAIAKLGLGKAAFIGDSSPVEDSTPKYLREDNGQAKVTYDGFSKEGDDGVFLVNTIDWLANHESYTSFDGKTTLDQPTPLLHNATIDEDPAKSTEIPGTEPWAAPDPGYKWWDASTYAAGSYGSDKPLPVNPAYSFVHQDILPNNGQAFQIRLDVDQLKAGMTLSSLKVGLYLDGGEQIGQFEGSTTYGYSNEFSVTAGPTGHAYKDLTVKIKPGVTGTAHLRIKQNNHTELTENVSLGDVAPVPLPPDVIPVPDKISITDARQKDEGTLVTVEGVVTTTPGTWGSKAFYLQDDTGGIYVYQGDTSYHLGEKVKLSAFKSTYNGEVELSNIVVSQNEGTTDLPEPKTVTSITDDNQGQLVRLEKIKVKNISQPDKYGTFEFDAVKGHTTNRVRIDSRSGLNYDQFMAHFKKGKELYLTGIASTFKGTFLLKPRSPEDVMTKKEYKEAYRDYDNDLKDQDHSNE